jgi:hypothetical protein
MKVLAIFAGGINYWMLNKCHSNSLGQYSSHSHTLRFHLNMTKKNTASNFITPIQ